MSVGQGMEREGGRQAVGIGKDGKKRKCKVGEWRTVWGKGKERERKIKESNFGEVRERGQCGVQWNERVGRAVSTKRGVGRL